MKIKNKLLAICAVAFLFIMMTAPIVQLGIRQQTDFNLIGKDNIIIEDPDVFILQIGTDENVQLAVDTFLDLYPGSAKIKQIDSWQELQDGLLSFSNVDHLLFGHGIDEGLDLSDEYLSWDTLRDFVNEKRISLYVMACNSGSEDGFYFGTPFEIDAETAGIISAIAFDENDLIKNAGYFDSIASLKQRICAHPLSRYVDFGSAYAREGRPYVNRVKKEFDSERKARFAVRFDRFLLVGGKNMIAMGKVIADNLALGFGPAPWSLGLPFLDGRMVEVKTTLVNAWGRGTLVKAGAWRPGCYIYCHDQYRFGESVMIPREMAHIDFRHSTFGDVCTVHIMYCVTGNNDYNNDDDAYDEEYIDPGITDEMKNTEPDRRDIREIIIHMAILAIIYDIIIRAYLDEEITFDQTVEATDGLIEKFLNLGIPDISVSVIAASILFGYIYTLIISPIGSALVNPLDLVEAYERAQNSRPFIPIFMDFITGPLRDLVSEFIPKYGSKGPSDPIWDMLDDDDGDGLPKFLEEWLYHLDDDIYDYDGDGYNDGYEVENGFDPQDPLSPDNGFMWRPSTLVSGPKANYTSGIFGIDRISWRKRFVGHVGGSGSWTSYTHVNTSGETFFTLEENIWSDYVSGPPYVDRITQFEFNHQIYYNNSYYSIYNMSSWCDDEGPVNDGDTDGDGLKDFLETDILGTSKFLDDHDSDGVKDGDEIFFGTNAKEGDTDGDGIGDSAEVNDDMADNYPQLAHQDEWDCDYDGVPNWLDWDADGDFLNDSFEDSYASGNCDYEPDNDFSNLYSNDTDNDGLLDSWEWFYTRTNLKSSDTDEDGFLDDFEVFNSLNALVADTNDWALYFADDFAENEDIYNNWDYASGSEGSMRRGGLPTNTYSNIEADEDFVTRVYNYTTDSYGDIVAHWPFEESPPGQTHNQPDITGNGHLAYAGYSPETTTDAKRGDYAVDFDKNDDDKYTVLDHNDFSFGDASSDSSFSISTWIKPDDVSDTTIIAKWGSSSQREYYLYIHPSNILIFGLIDGTWAAQRGRKTNSDIFTAGTWYHVAITYDGRGGTNAEDGIDIYINGIVSDTGDYNGASAYTAMHNFGGPLYIAKRGDDNKYFDGIIDDPRIYNCELSPRAVYELYQNPWVIESGNPGLVQKYENEYEIGSVLSWDLTNLRSSSPAEAIESAEITLEYVSGNGYWGYSDDCQISLINAYAEGGYLNDTSPDSHAIAVCPYALRTMKDVDVSGWDDSTIDITALLDCWYLYSNDTIFSILITPEEDNAVSHIYPSESVFWAQDPKITIKTGDSILRADDYGSGEGSHGPEIYHNFGCDIDDFELIGQPYLEGSTSGRGRFLLRFYSEDDATGTEIGHVYWKDAWTGLDAGKLYFYWNGAYQWDSGTTDYKNWFDADTANFTVTRNGTTIEFVVNGDTKYTNATVGGSTAIRSVRIDFYQIDSGVLVPKLGLRSISFRGHSDNYDDDYYTNAQEEDYGGSVWIKDDSFEVYHPTSNGWSYISQPDGTGAIWDSIYYKSGTHSMRYGSSSGSLQWVSAKWDSTGTVTDCVVSGYARGTSSSQLKVGIYQDSDNEIYLRFMSCYADLYSTIDGSETYTRTTVADATYAGDWWYYEVHFDITNKRMTGHVYNCDDDELYELNSHTWTGSSFTGGYIQTGGYVKDNQFCNHDMISVVPFEA